ncbi:MAG: 2OG-Fe(II) oxygenase [Nanoarchaeota archaeon]|nr:2OG-Fe(II) oxygenase [Nanoarchaeota archaeon]
MINPVDTKSLQEQFRKAKPFPFIALDQFLEGDSIKELAQALSQEEFFLKESDLFTLYQTNDLVSSTNPVMKKFYEFFKSKEFIGFCRELTGIDFTPDVVDLQGSIYQDTNFLLCHDDQLEGRKLAFLLYLTDMQEEDGGALTLFDNKEGVPTKVAQRIIPKINRFACFEVNENSFHEVEEVLTDKQRLAIGGWLH